jgi:poly(3-hydroxybutyrate) depolymerase
MRRGSQGAKPLLYHWYLAGHAAVKPARAAADSYKMFFKHPFNPLTHTSVGRSAAAACEVFERTTRRYDKPVFGIPSTVVDGETLAISEETVWQRPFCNLVRFKRATPASGKELNQPRLLLVAPMSGHYATLLRGTVETFLPDHDVYITDWQNARDVPASAGAFDLDDYVDTVADICRFFEGDVHVFAVCQPAVPVLAAIADMEAANDPHVPHSLMIAGGPIDTRRSPTAVNKLAQEKGTEWFRSNVISTVPWPSPGYGRKVYPGFLQLTGFMTMNLDRHMNAQKDMFLHLVHGDGDGAEKHREFYDEYLAVMDLTAEYYLETIASVFVEHRLPRGEMRHRGRKIDLAAIKNVALMTIEGENDDITGKGQCSSAIDLCSNIPASKKQHFECPKVGHYGVFNGSRFRSEIAPRMGAFLRRFDDRTKDQPQRKFKSPAPSNATDVVDNGDWIGGEEPAFALTAVTAAANVNSVQVATRLADYSLDVIEQTMPAGSVGNPFIADKQDIHAAATPWTMLSMVNSATLDFWTKLGTPSPSSSDVAKNGSAAKA